MDKVNLKASILNTKKPKTEVDHWLEASILHVISDPATLDGKTFKEVWGKDYEDQDGVMNVELKINGKDVSFVKLISHLEEHFKHSVELTSGRYVDKQIMEATTKLQDVVGSFKEAMEAYQATLAKK